MLPITGPLPPRSRANQKAIAANKNKNILYFLMKKPLRNRSTKKAEIPTEVTK